jgi:ADP-glucose pyrophosphorylase
LAGGRGSRLLELTDRRAKPAVFFGCKSRIIDFALSNALNSGIRRIGVATQYKAHSLIRHLQRGCAVSEAGGLHYARERALRLAQQADGELDALPPSPARDALRAAITYVVDRRR